MKSYIFINFFFRPTKNKYLMYRIHESFALLSFGWFFFSYFSITELATRTSTGYGYHGSCYISLAGSEISCVTFTGDTC